MSLDRARCLARNYIVDEQRRDHPTSILDEFADVLQDKPGKTTIMEHTIETGTASPMRQHPY